MTTTVTWERLRDLAAFRAEKGCAVSLFLNLDPSVAPTAGDAMTRINSLLSEAERALDAGRPELTHDQKQALRADLQRIRAYFDDEFDRDGAQAFAVFASSLDGAWTPIALTDPVDDVVKVNKDFYVAPLVPLVGRGAGALVAVVSRERGEIYRLRGGQLHAVVDESEDAPSRHDQGGWSQARYQRHIDNLAAQHMGDVADALDRLVRSSNDVKVVVVCSEENRPVFEEGLSNGARAAVVGWASAEAHAGPAELLGVVTPWLEQARAAKEEELLARWREEAGKGARAASGWGQTLDAVSDARAEVLIYAASADRPAWQCPQCGRLGADGGACPLDGTPMEERDNGLDLAVRQTLAHGGTVWALGHGRDLDPVDGIGALLRY
jgi:peptide chain release factor subunit 1